MEDNKWPSYTSADFQNKIDKYLEKYKSEVSKEPTIECKKEENENADTDDFNKLECKKITLLPQQKIISDLINDKTPYRGLLLYHEVGSGKTFTAVNIAEQTRKKVIILVPSKIKKVWIFHIIQLTCKKYLTRPQQNGGLNENNAKENNAKYNKEDNKKDNKEYDKEENNEDNNEEKTAKQIKREKMKSFRKIIERINNKYTFISSNANNTKDLLAKEDLNDKLIIIDECHRLFHTVTLTEQGKNIYKQLLDAKRSKFLLLSGTPAISDPYELALTFTLLRGKIFDSGETGDFNKSGGSDNFGNQNNSDNFGNQNKQIKKGTKQLLFPGDYEQFVEYFVDRDAMRIKNKNIFQERIIGLVSYYKSVIKEPESKKEGPMVPKIIGPTVQHLKMSTYQWTKYSKNRSKELEEERRIAHRKKEFKKNEFGLPGRSSSSTYKIKSRQALNFVLPPRGIDNVELLEPGKKEIGQENIWTELFQKINPKDLKRDEIGKYSPKIKYILDYLDKTPKGIILVYSNYLEFGTKIIAKVLENNGFVEYNGKEINTNKDGNFMTFSLLSGETDPEQIKNILNKVNNKENKYGKNIRVLLITSAFSEGETINNVNTIFIFEPHWKYYRIQQVIGRAVRICTHNYLPPEERNVKVYILLIIAYNMDVRLAIGEKSENSYDTTDTMIYQEAILKQKILDSFLQAVKEIAIDCNTLLSHNSNNDKNFKCLSCSNPKSQESNYYSDINKHIAQRKINRNTYCIQKTIIDELIGPIIIENVLFVYDPDTGNVYQITNIRYVGHYDRKFKKVIFIPPTILILPISVHSNLPKSHNYKNKQDVTTNKQDKIINKSKNIQDKIINKSKNKVNNKRGNKGGNNKEDEAKINIKKIMKKREEINKKMDQKMKKEELLKLYTDIYDDPKELKGIIRTPEFDKTGILYHQKTLNAYEILPKIIKAGYYDFDNKKIVLFDNYKVHDEFEMYQKFKK